MLSASLSELSRRLLARARLQSRDPDFSLRKNVGTKNDFTIEPKDV